MRRYIVILVLVPLITLMFATSVKSNNDNITGVGFIPVDYNSKFHHIRGLGEDSLGLFHKVIINMKVPSTGEIFFSNVLLLVNTNPHPVLLIITTHNKKFPGIREFSLVMRDNLGHTRSLNVTGNNKIFVYIPPNSTENISFLLNTFKCRGTYNFTILFYLTSPP